LCWRSVFRWILGLTIAFTVYLCAHWFFTHKAFEFLTLVHVGDSRDQILAAVGEPVERHDKGAELLPWGGTKPRLVTDEAWVYYFGPSHIYRISLFFRNGIVDRIYHDRT
jgi:hypothetical protein